VTEPAVTVHVGAPDQIGFGKDDARSWPGTASPRIRAVDSRTALFYEPNVLFNNGAQTAVRPHASRLGFSFHDYCLTAEAGTEGGGEQLCDGFDGLVWSNTAAHVQETGHAPLLTEFGATTDVPTITGMVDRAEQAMTGWQFWA
jgi:endoglycosylceramidase